MGPAADHVLMRKLNRAIGDHLKHHAKGRGILKSAHQKNVPAFVPAFTDSEMGLDVALNNRMRARGRQAFCSCATGLISGFKKHFAETLLQAEKDWHFDHWRRRAQKLGATVWSLLRTARASRGRRRGAQRYHYGVRICPEPVYWGGLFAFPYSEAISWGRVCAAG